jgi:hypothetical protein
MYSTLTVTQTVPGVQSTETITLKGTTITEVVSQVSTPGVSSKAGTYIYVTVTSTVNATACVPTVNPFPTALQSTVSNSTAATFSSATTTNDAVRNSDSDTGILTATSLPPCESYPPFMRGVFIACTPTGSIPAATATSFVVGNYTSPNTTSYGLVPNRTSPATTSPIQTVTSSGVNGGLAPTRTDFKILCSALLVLVTIRLFI